MPSIIFSLVFVFLTNFLIQAAASTSPTDLRNLELDDIASLQHEFPSIIGKIKVVVNQLYCPKGWRYFSGSCYYLSKIISTPTQANHTCNRLHSNYSNLMEIHNRVELFYAVHILTKNNLSELMINVDPNLLKEKNTTAISMDDQVRWQRMEDKSRELRIRYQKLKEKFINELNAAGLRISRRSKKRKQTLSHTQDYYNDTIEVDEYQYDNLNSEDKSDEFERICDQINWNIRNNNATVYMLTVSIISDKMICSLSDVVRDTKSRYVCQYVLNFCFANNECGKHGRCVNTLSGFKCSCSFLYDGRLCERISNQGKQILVGLIVIFVLYGLSIKPIQWALISTIKSCIILCKRGRKKRQNKKPNKPNNSENGTQKLVGRHRKEENHEETQEQSNMVPSLPIVPLKIKQFLFPKQPDPNKRDLIRLLWVTGLSILFLLLLISLTTILHFISFQYDTKLDSIINNTDSSVAKCESISNYRTKTFSFLPIALALIVIFSWTIKREKHCLNLCNGRPGLIPPIEPFGIENRFTTAAVFGILAFEILQTFEERFFSTRDLFNDGILIELLEIIGLVLLIGLQYYPVLASLQLRNIIARFLVCLYILANSIYTIIKEGLCIGYNPVLKEAKLRMGFDTWFFIIYGLIKTAPYFILLSYIVAELIVRFAYDSIYVPIKKKRSIWSSPVTQSDESAFAEYYVTKLFRRNLRSNRIGYSTDVTIDALEDYQHETELPKSRNKQCLHWDDDFHFTTIATCTYTVAVVFLYYLSCTFVFLYISQTTGYISFVKYYIETTFNIELQGFFSVRSIVIISGVITVGIIIIQLIIEMKNYKKHKLQLFKGIYENIPSASNFTSTAIASNSVHYFGFLVGHIACSFIILFHLIIFILCSIRIISLRIPYIELLLGTTVPVIVVYLLIRVSMLSAGNCLFRHGSEEKPSLKNRQAYAIFVYFNFFIDCFLGFASSIIRLIKAAVFNVFYMARLDFSLYGRSSERCDLGFAAYVSYLHMEVTHTNPIMLAFCHSLYNDIVQRRPNYHQDQINIELKPMVTENVSSKTNVREQESVSSITDENNSIDMKDLSIKGTKSPSSSISQKHSQRSKRHITNDILEPNISTTYSIISYLPNSEGAYELREIRRQKQARFRWFLAYTLLRNYQLFDLRKDVRSRLALLNIVRSNLMDEQREAAAIQRSDMEIETPESSAIRPRQRQTKTTTTHGQIVLPVESDVDTSLSTDDSLQQTSNISPAPIYTSKVTEV